MKIRHINNIIIELQGWEAQPLLVALRMGILNAIMFDDEGKDFINNLIEKLDRLTEREA